MTDKIRSQETKQKFKEAFFDLYATRKIETITIKEISDIAGYNRGTFYLYYKSIYDLLQQTEKELLDDFTKEVELHIKMYLGEINENSKQLYENIETKMHKNHKYMSILNGENGDPRFKFRMKQIIKDIYRKNNPTFDNPAINIKLDYLLEYIVEANISIIQYWNANKNKNLPHIPLEEVLEIVDYVSNNGFKKALEKYCKN